MKIGRLKKCFGLLLTTPLLASAAAATVIDSNILGGSISNVYAEQVLVDMTSTNICRTDGKDSTKNIAMEVTVDYEFIKMNHGLLNVNWAETYTLLYRVKVDLYDSVQYKGGLFDWFNKTANATLSRIKVDLDIPTLPSGFYEINDSNDDLNSDIYEYSLNHESDNPYAYYYDNIYEGGYYTSMYWFDESSSSSNNKNFYARKSDISSGEEIDYSYYFDFDVLKGTQDYENKIVYIFGSYSFASDSLPNDISLKVEVQSGLKQETEDLYRGDSSDKLSSGRVGLLLDDGYVPINSTYDHTVDWSQTYVLN